MNSPDSSRPGSSTETLMPRHKILVVLSIGALAFGLGVWLSLSLIQQRAEPPTIAGILLDPPKPVEEFTLIDQNGQSFHRDRWRGQWTFLYFGYTFCPDVCPLTLVELSKLQKRLAQDNLDQNNAYLFISVDPRRDTPQRLKEYAPYFNPKFQGATGTAEELAKLAAQFGVYYKVPDTTDANYPVDHSSTITLIDPQGQLRAVFTQTNPDIMAADFRKIVDFAASAH